MTVLFYFLPDEIVTSIVYFLDADSVLNLSLVSKRFLFIRYDFQVWKRLVNNIALKIIKLSKNNKICEFKELPATKDYYLKLKRFSYDKNNGLIYAVRTKDIPLIEFFLQNGANSFIALKEAAKSTLEIYTLLKERNINKWNGTISHRYVSKFSYPSLYYLNTSFIEMIIAIKHKNMEIVKYIHKRHSKDYFQYHFDEIVTRAVEFGNYEAVNYFSKFTMKGFVFYTALNYNDFLLAFCYYDSSFVAPVDFCSSSGHLCGCHITKFPFTLNRFLASLHKARTVCEFCAKKCFERFGNNPMFIPLGDLLVEKIPSLKEKFDGFYFNHLKFKEGKITCFELLRRHKNLFSLPFFSLLIVGQTVEELNKIMFYLLSHQFNSSYHLDSYIVCLRELIKCGANNFDECLLECKPCEAYCYSILLENCTEIERIFRKLLKDELKEDDSPFFGTRYAAKELVKREGNYNKLKTIIKEYILPMKLERFFSKFID